MKSYVLGVSEHASSSYVMTKQVTYGIHGHAYENISSFSQIKLYNLYLVFKLFRHFCLYLEYWLVANSGCETFPLGLLTEVRCDTCAQTDRRTFREHRRVIELNRRWCALYLACAKMFTWYSDERARCQK